MSESGKVIAADGHVYHKSKSANATTAPTNQATLDKAQQKHLTADQIQFVTVFDYEFHLGRATDEHLSDEYGYTQNELNDLFSDTLVQQALLERGIDLSKIKAPVEKHAKLSPVQLIAANRLMDLTDNRSDKKKLQDIGVTTLQYTAWQSDPEFAHYMRERAENLLGASQHDILLALMDSVKARNPASIKLALELTGRFQSQTSSSQGGNSNHDLNTMVMRIVEIIIDEVDDPQLSVRIADRIQGLVTAGQVAGVLAPQVKGEVVTPELATPRVITDQVQSMMDQGVGYDA